MYIDKIKEIMLSKFHKKPKILGIEETIEKILNGYSISRFGDGEFFLMTKEKEFTFQSLDNNLIDRLLEVFNSKEEKLLIGIPKVFDKKDLNLRTEESKQWWKNYLIDHRKIWYKYIDFEKIYANTNFTRNYMGLKDKTTCKQYFDSIKNIWNNKDLLIIEGKYSRLGVGNDLFDNAKSIERILAPNENAFDKYEKILNRAKLENQSKLVLIALGPTATVLAYDLYKLGYQALDIGHIDIEYEWFLQGAQVKTKIDNKYVFEVNNFVQNENFKDKIYESQIIEIID